MNTVLTQLLFYSITLKSIHSLECHVTDFVSFEASNRDVHSTIKNCDTFFKEIIKPQTNSDRVSNIEDDLRCFSVRIESERTNIAIQGCTPQDGCNKIINELALNNSSSGVGVTCWECSGNLCNGEDLQVVRSVFQSARSALEKKTYLILTIVMIVVFMGVISIMLRIFTKKSRGVEKKYSKLLV